MNPYEWPWENPPVDSSESDRVTTRLRKKVRRLSRKVSRMDRELRKMRKAIQRLAAASAPAPRPPVSERTLRLVGEAQRAAALYSATRSGKAAQEAARTRDALLRHVAELESGRAQPGTEADWAPSPGAPQARSAVPQPPAPAPPPAPRTAAPEAPPSAPPRSGPQPAAAPPVPDSMYRWMRDAVSLLRAAGFASAGHGILRDQLTEQALSFMAQRAAQAGPHPPANPQGARSGGEAERAPIGRPRLGGAPLAPPSPPSMTSRPTVRHPDAYREPPGPELEAHPEPQAWVQGPDMALDPEPQPYREAPRPEPVHEQAPESGAPMREPFRMEAALSDHPPYDSSAETPLSDPGEGSWPVAHPNGDTTHGDTGQEVAQGPVEEDESGPRRWWSYAPIPPRPEE